MIVNKEHLHTHTCTHTPRVSSVFIVIVENAVTQPRSSCEFILDPPLPIAYFMTVKEHVTWQLKPHDPCLLADPQRICYLLLVLLIRYLIVAMI